MFRFRNLKIWSLRMAPPRSSAASSCPFIRDSDRVPFASRARSLTRPAVRSTANKIVDDTPRRLRNRFNSRRNNPGIRNYPPPPRQSERSFFFFSLLLSFSPFFLFFSLPLFPQPDCNLVSILQQPESARGFLLRRTCVSMRSHTKIRHGSACIHN